MKFLKNIFKPKKHISTVEYLYRPLIFDYTDKLPTKITISNRIYIRYIRNDDGIYYIQYHTKDIKNHTLKITYWGNLKISTDNMYKWLSNNLKIEHNQYL